MSGDLTFGMRLNYDAKGAIAGMKETRAEMEGIAQAGEKVSAGYADVDKAMRKSTESCVPAAEGLRTFGKTSEKVTLSAGEMRNAMRQLPMQFTDISVGLATGQSPMMVLLQQGGQLKDMFGGVGNAAKALGGYVMGLVNPVTVVAGAVAAGAYAWYHWGDAAREAAAKADDAMQTAEKRAVSSRRLNSTEQIAALQTQIIGVNAEIEATRAKLARLGNDSSTIDLANKYGRTISADKDTLANLQRQIAEIQKANPDKGAQLAGQSEYAKRKELEENLKIETAYRDKQKAGSDEYLKSLSAIKGLQDEIAKIDKKDAQNPGLTAQAEILRQMAGDFDRQAQARQRGMQVMSDSARTLGNELDKISKAEDTARQAATKNYVEGKLSADQYKETLAKINAEAERQSAAMVKMRSMQDQLNGSWQYGAAVALQKYQDDVSNTAASTEKLFSSSMRNMENAEVAMLRKGSADWRAFGDVVFNELVRINLAKANAGIMNMAMGFFGGSQSTPNSVGSGGFSNNSSGETLSFAGGGYTGSGARSGGLDGMGGFMAMLHPQETVIDHTMQAPNTGSGNVISIQVSIDARGNSQSQSSNQDYNALGQRSAAAMRAVIMDEMRPGGLLARG